MIDFLKRILEGFHEQEQNELKFDVPENNSDEQEQSKQEFDVSENPFNNLGMSLKQITFFKGTVNINDLYERARKICCDDYYGPRSVVVADGIDFCISKQLKIISIYISSQEYRKKYKYRYDLYPIDLPAGLSFKMSQVETRNILGNPDFSRLDTFLTTFIIPGEPYYLDRYYFIEGCLELRFNYPTKILESLDILQSPREVLPDNYIITNRWENRL